MATTAGKRERERAKQEKAQAKAERKAARQAAEPDGEEIPSGRSESEVIEDLGALHRALETGEVSPEDFEERRDQLRRELEQLS
jgi:hypothetical protein